MATFTLTAGPDTFVGGVGDYTVNGTAATLNAGDSLTGGAGTDTLALYGSGTFRVDQLATFVGFESITLNNFTNGAANLYLGSQPIAVTGYGPGSEALYLGSGATTFHGGGGGSNYIFSDSPSSWNAGNVIDGSSQYSGYLYLNWNGSENAVYDLTANTLAHINTVYANGRNLTLKIDSADAVGVSSFYAVGTNDQLLTSDTALDLSHSTVSGFTVASTHAAGTTFTVQDVGTAFQIAGGPGQDTIAAAGFAFTADQRNALFATASIEKITDTSGTYIVPPTVIQLTPGADTVTPSVSNITVNATSVTLNDGDQLSAGSGHNVLALYGAGTFHLDTLAQFSGFSDIRLNNFSVGSVNLYLRNDGSEVSVTFATAQSSSDSIYLASSKVSFRVFSENRQGVFGVPAIEEEHQAHGG